MYLIYIDWQCFFECFLLFIRWKCSYDNCRWSVSSRTWKFLLVSILSQINIIILTLSLVHFSMYSCCFLSIWARLLSLEYSMCNSIRLCWLLFWFVITIINWRCYIFLCFSCFFFLFEILNQVITRFLILLFDMNYELIILMNYPKCQSETLGKYWSILISCPGICCREKTGRKHSQRTACGMC